MKKICFILDTRITFMKAIPIYEALKNNFQLLLIHVRNNFDENINDGFFNQLQFPRPDISMSLQKRTTVGDVYDQLYVHNDQLLNNNKDKIIDELMTYDGDMGQLGEIRDMLIVEFNIVKPDLVMVFGDRTSTFGAGLSAKIVGVNLVHVESGLRDGDLQNPREVNRILIDHITTYHIVTEQSGVDHLNSSGISENVYLVGNTLIDTQKKYLEQSLKTRYYGTLGLQPKDYVLVTLNHQKNTKDLVHVEEIFNDLNDLSTTEILVVLLSASIKSEIETTEFFQTVQQNENIIIQEPIGYLEFTCLLANSKYVITDRSGVQEESTSLNVPCFTLSETSERQSTFIENNGTNQLIRRINDIELKECRGNMILWDGKSSYRIYGIVLKNIMEFHETEKFDKIILIPIGGLGTRFKENDYKRPKTLINIFGQPLIFHLLDNLDIDDETIVYIVYNHEYEKYRFEDMIVNNYSDVHFKFHHLLDNTEGAAETINIALQHIDLNYDLPVLCLDSDNFYTENIIEKWNQQNGILYFEDFYEKPLYSYIEYNHDYTIVDIKEKEKISNNACCGGYGFSSYKQLLYYTQKVLDENFRFKDEFYTSSCIKRMLNDSITFHGIKINKENFHCLGTPLQLKQFYNNVPNVSCIGFKKKMKVLRFCFDLDNTLVTFPKTSGDYSTVEPIEKTIHFLRYLKNFGHTIIIYTARRMKTHHGNMGRVLVDIGQVTLDTLEKFNIPYDELYFGKPHADFYIDDNAVSAYDNLEKEIGFYQDTIKTRDFNSVEKTFIQIYTKRSKNLAGEIYYYSNIPSEIKDMFPLFIDYDIHNTWYSIEKINGLTISTLYLSELLTSNTLESIMKSIKRIQTVNVPVDQHINIYKNYKDKLKQRYEEYNYNKFPNSKETYLKLYEQLHDYEIHEKGKIACIHGDSVFTNILINEHEKIKFIDMRGEQGNKLTIYGDWLYDWGKLYQSLLGYDEILLDKDIQLTYKKKMLDTFKTIFTNWFSEEDFQNVVMITNSLLFTLIPLHDNEKCIQYYNMIKI